MAKRSSSIDQKVEDTLQYMKNLQEIKNAYFLDCKLIMNYQPCIEKGKAMEDSFRLHWSKLQKVIQEYDKKYPNG